MKIRRAGAVLALILSISTVASLAASYGEKRDGDSISGPGTSTKVFDGARVNGKGADGGTGKVGIGDAAQDLVKSKTAATVVVVAASPADVKMADAAIVQKALKEVTRNEKNAAVFDAFIEAMGTTPGPEHDASHLAEMGKALLDMAGLCSACELERQAAAAAHAGELGKAIVNQAKVEEKKPKVNFRETRP